VQADDNLPQYGCPEPTRFNFSGPAEGAIYSQLDEGSTLLKKGVSTCLLEYLDDNHGFRDGQSNEELRKRTNRSKVARANWSMTLSGRCIRHEVNTWLCPSSINFFLDPSEARTESQCSYSSLRRHSAKRSPFARESPGFS
jgi:hypothetical protein